MHETLVPWALIGVIPDGWMILTRDNRDVTDKNAGVQLQLDRMIYAALAVIVTAAIAGGALGRIVVADPRDPFLTFFGTGLGAWVGCGGAVVAISFWVGGSKRAARSALVIGIMSFGVVIVIYLVGAFLTWGFDPYSHQYWPDELVELNDDAVTIVMSAKSTFGDPSSGSLGSMGASYRSTCSGDMASSIGRDALGRLPLPAPGDSLPRPMRDLWEQWSDAGLQPTEPIWGSDLSVSGRRRSFLAYASDGTRFEVWASPVDPNPWGDDGWTARALDVSIEYETVCVDFG